MNLFKEMFYAVVSPGMYSTFLKNKAWKIFFYGVLLLSLYFFVTVLFPFSKFQLVNGGASGFIREYVPEFSYEDGALWLREPIEWIDDSSYIVVDTSPDFYLEDLGDYRRKFNNYRNVLVTDGYDILIKNNGQYASGSLEELFGMEPLDNGDLNAVMSVVDAILVVGVILLYFLELAFFFFGILILALIAMIFDAIMDTRLSFGKLFIFSVYARTLPLAVKAMLQVLSFHMPFFWVVNFGISVLYLYLACRAVKKQAKLVEVNVVQ